MGERHQGFSDSFASRSQTTSDSTPSHRNFCGEASPEILDHLNCGLKEPGQFGFELSGNSVKYTAIYRIVGEFLACLIQ